MGLKIGSAGENMKNLSERTSCHEVRYSEYAVKYGLLDLIMDKPMAIFCSPQCKNKYNVYKSRAKDKRD